MSELHVLFPEPEYVRIKSRVVAIHPVRLKHFESFGAAATGLFTLLGNSTVDEIYAYARQTGALTAILAHCTSLSRWRIRLLPAAVAVSLMIHVVRVNNSFFDKALLEMASLLAGPLSRSN